MHIIQRHPYFALPRLQILIRLLMLALTLATTLLATLIALPAGAAEDFLDPEQAFKLTARIVDERNVELAFDVAPGYYLYGESFRFSAVGATLGTPQLPPGHVKFDETFQKNVQTHRALVRIVVPLTPSGANYAVLVTNQGCADQGLCYPPMQRAIQVTGHAAGLVRVLTTAQTTASGLAAATEIGIASSAAPSGVTTARASGLPVIAGLDDALRGGRFWTVVLVFFIAGTLLSLTPCVLPMLPILSSIIVGHGSRVSRGRGLLLAASYSLGMATVYTALGVAAGLAGEGLAAALQTPWVLGLFALGLVALALSMFGVYEIQLPTHLASRLARASQRLPAGHVFGVFAMGGVSALIVSPCVAAPLAGALVYLSQTRDVWLGGTALFSLACGMSVPLLLVGASAGALLPRAGGWMNEVKRFFGMLLLGVALWMLVPVLPGALVLALCGALAIGVAVLVVSQSHGRRIGMSKILWRRALAGVFAVVGVLQLVGAAAGGSNPLQPLANLTSRQPADTALPGLQFVAVRNVAELDAALRGAGSAGRPVMLDFYADWCVSCKEMERFTFTDPAVRAKLAGVLLLKADVTANQPGDRELLKRFNLFGPPGTIFFDVQGREMKQVRVIGYQDAERFIATLLSAGL